MIVVDASTLTDALVVRTARGEWARARLSKDSDWTAPDYLLAEVFSAIRGLRLGGHISRGRADDALTVLREVAVDLVPTRFLLASMDRLSDVVGGYDAGYVAVALRRDVPLVTTDGRLARGAGPYVTVETPE